MDRIKFLKKHENSIKAKDKSKPIRLSDLSDQELDDLIKEPVNKGSQYYIVEKRPAGGQREGAGRKSRFKGKTARAVVPEACKEFLLRVADEYHETALKTMRRPLTRMQISRIWNDISNRCGIQGATPHSARITQPLENNCASEDVQKIAGHRLIKTTQMYDQRPMILRKSASFAVRY